MVDYITILIDAGHYCNVICSHVWLLVAISLINMSIVYLLLLFCRSILFCQLTASIALAAINECTCTYVQKCVWYRFDYIDVH